MLDYRVGLGFDSHRLVKGRRLVLGGVEIPGEFGLLGHSDADVLIHALIDALFGALALGDIGEHFPNSDDAYKDAPGATLLNITLGKIRAIGYEVVNVDATLILELPRLSPFKCSIREKVSNMLGIEENRVSVKAKTAEAMGALGRGEGIACNCVVLLCRSDS